jgi:hypothetical protein
VSGTLASSAALWNRDRLDLSSDEILAQILDRGELHNWRELFDLASRDRGLRHRIAGVARRVPLAYAGFWLAAMASLGEGIDWSVPLPEDEGI